MQVHRLIKGGTVVDGTGAPAFRADIRIRDGKISEIGPDLQPAGREHVIDATGCYVTPGFIDLHNHWDVGIWWTPTVDPSSAYGITTSINGNCAFSAAPLSADPQSREDLIEIFNFFEDIPEAGVSLKLGDIPVEIVQTQGRAVKIARIHIPAPAGRVSGEDST